MPEIETRGRLTLVTLRAGALAIGHRPPLRALPAMRKAGVTHITTVLSRDENAEAIGAAAKQAGLGWLWIELGSTKALPAVRRSDIVEAVRTMAAILDEGDASICTAQRASIALA